jgi:gamma-glutamyl hercynylcysteine S-oxide synthase
MATTRSSTLRQQLHRQLLDARANTDSLFRIVREDFLYERPIAERHRIVFYVGHLEAFDWNLLRERLLLAASQTPEFDKLFAFGIDPVGGGLPTDQPKDWPSLDEVRGYVGLLRAKIDNALDEGNFSAPESNDEAKAEELLQVAIEHRLMHAETLAYMFHRLPHEKKIREAQFAPEALPVENSLVEIPAGEATLGLSRGAAPFGWDNEFETLVVNVPRFRIQKYMVSNAEFLEFLEDDGYGAREFWSAEDWQWKESNAIRHPAFWRQDGPSWVYRGMFEEFPLPAAWPAYVSHAEACAYARWSKQTLPNEAQWHRAAYGTPTGERSYPWGEAAPDTSLGNFDFARWDAAPVNAYPRNQSAFGVAGLIGNGWEWTATHFGPFPGFAPFSFYPGYSANFFDNQHFVMKGGSARTAARLLRRSFRNWFQPHYPYVYAGFRCVSE